MKQGWEVKKLGEVCVIRPPKDEARKKLKENDLVSFLPMEDLGINQKEFVTSKERLLKDVEGSYTYFANEDVLLAKITPCFENGKLGIARNLTNGIGFGSSEYFVFRPSIKIKSDFLYYYFLLDQFRVEGSKKMMGAVGHKRVAKEFIENSKVPIPPLHEQQKIVGILDEVFAGIAKAKENAEKNLANAREIFTSYLNSVFESPGKDWEVKKLGEVCKIIGGGTPSKQKKEYWLNGNIKWISSKHIDDEGFVKGFELITEFGLKKSSSQVIPKGNIILITRVSVGKLAFTDDSYAINQDLTGLIRNDEKKINSKFLFYFAKLFTKNIEKDAVGIGVRGVTKEYVYNIQIPYPSISDQLRIVDTLENLYLQTKKLEAIYQQKLADLEDLKKSVLQKAFNGELTMGEA